MASREGKRPSHETLVPLAALLSRETRAAKMEKPIVRYGEAAQSRKGEDYLLINTDTTFSVFAVTLKICSVINILINLYLSVVFI